MGSLFCVFEFTDWYLQEKYFYYVFFSLGLVFTRDTSYFQVCVVAEQKYNQWTFPNVVFILFYPSTFNLINPLAYILLQKYFGITICDEYILVNVVLGLIILEYIVFVYSVVTQIASILHINVFSMTQEQIRKLDEKLKL